MAAEQIHVHVTDDLVNIGNSALPYLEVSLPAAQSVRLANLGVRVNGQQVKPVTALADPAAPERIPFQKSWKPGDARTIVFDYDLQPNPGVGPGAVGASAQGFYIADPSAFPHWQPPVGVFVKADVRAGDEVLGFSVPPGFLVFAPGKEQDASATAAQPRFRVTPADFPPFAIAGRYQERAIITKNAPVIFWTFDPLEAAPARQAADRLAATSAEYERLFGALYNPPRHKRAVRWPVYVVQAPAPLPALDAPVAAPRPDVPADLSALSFPQGILLEQRIFARGPASEPVLELAEYELAQSWFGWRVQVPPAAQSLLRDGLARFAVLDAAETREGEPARRRAIAAWIAAFDAYRAAANLPHSASAPTNFPIVPIIPRTPQERAAAGFKCALFYVALEELAGKQKFALALHNLVRDMAGASVGEADLRSAMEAASGRDLAAMFRSWLTPADIPADFRARHSTP